MRGVLGAVFPDGGEDGGAGGEAGPGLGDEGSSLGSASLASPAGAVPRAAGELGMAPLSSSEVHKLKQSPAWPGGSVAQEAGPFHTKVNRDPGARWWGG